MRLRERQRKYVAGCIGRYRYPFFITLRTTCEFEFFALED